MFSFCRVGNPSGYGQYAARFKGLELRLEVGAGDLYLVTETSVCREISW